MPTIRREGLVRIIVTPEQLHWQFRAADGTVLASGDGILTP
jgi:hypothetical protein